LPVTIWRCWAVLATPLGSGSVLAQHHAQQLCRAAIRHNQSGWSLSRFIDPRETLKQIDGSVDFMLVDIWIARPALELVTPTSQGRRYGHLRQHRIAPRRVS
jgi:hypothetical protein